MATFPTNQTHVRRPLRIRLRLFIDRSERYRGALPFIYLAGAAGAVLSAAFGLGPPFTGLLIGALGTYIVAALVYALDGHIQQSNRKSHGVQRHNG